jgi:hypothetical protein
VVAILQLVRVLPGIPMLEKTSQNAFDIQGFLAGLPFEQSDKP